MGKLWDFFTRNEGKDVEVTPDSLKKEITELGYNGDAYDVGVQDDTITIRGEAASQEEKEKVVLAMGNVKGVSNVDELDPDLLRRGGREPGKPAGPGGIPLLHGAERRHPVEDRPRVLRRRQRLHEDLRGQPADAQGPRPDLSRSGPADSDLGAVGATLLSVSPGSSSRATAAVLNSAVYRLRVFVVIPVLQVVRKLTTRSGLAGHGHAVLLPNKSVTQRVALNEAQYLLLCPGEN